MRYMVITHPQSGERYAVETSTDGRLLRAAGPLHHTDPRDPQSLRGWLDNTDPGDAEEDAQWLQGEIDRQW